jgi:hypothetical protein
MVGIWKKVGEDRRRRVFLKRKVERAKGERAAGMTTNIRRKERGGRRKRRPRVLGILFVLLF